MSEILSIVNDIRNEVNSVCSELGLGRLLRKINNAVYGNNFLERPIGIVTKNYDYIKAALDLNIGGYSYKYDGYGTNIGSMSDPDLTSKEIPWFKEDPHRQKYSNYLAYLDSVYYNGSMPFPNFSRAEDKAKYFNFRSLLLENNHVGVVRGYDVFDRLFANKLLPNGVQTNANGFIDTRLGVINNFYLNATLNNSFIDMQDRRWSYLPPIQGNSNYMHPEAPTITQGAYSQFGLIGDKGLKNGGLTLKNGEVMPQQELTLDIIPYTPFSQLVSAGIETESGSNLFGFYEGIEPSKGLIDASPERTRRYIAKSWFGSDLLLKEGREMARFNPLESYLHKDNRWLASTYSIKTNVDKNRYLIKNFGNAGEISTHTLYAYAEQENYVVPNKIQQTLTHNSGVNFGIYNPYNINSASQNDIIKYTNTCFRQGRYDTLIARFHTPTSSKEDDFDMFATAVSQYGMSHGRNLLKKNPSNENGYDNPYCRVWTYHHQYSKLEDAIRPFDNQNEINQNVTKYQVNRSHLVNNGVRGDNHLVRIAPTAKDNVKKCMFSIENLAWRHERDGFNGYSNQRGPLNGRIMWFPPYNLKFSENANVQWNQTQFIGRGESIYTYTNTDRTGTLSFSLLIDHPSLINDYRHEQSSDDTGITVNVDNPEQKLLRFFAGCEVLEPTKTAPKVAAGPEPESVTEPALPKPHNTESTKTISFYVYFPNNYSGVDDIKPDSKINPINYLLYGIGTQLRGDEVSEDMEVSPTKPIYADTIGKYLNAQTNVYSGKNLINTYDCFGYEMSANENQGISVGLERIVNNADTNVIVEIDDAVAGKLLPIVCKSRVGNSKNYWGYRVDNRYKGQILSQNKNYYDTKSFQLNGSGYTKVKDFASIYVDGSKDYLCSFAEFVIAMGSDSQITDEFLTKYGINKERCMTIKKLLKRGVESANIVGYASSHGHTEDNKRLALDRAKTIQNWLPKDFNAKVKSLEVILTKSDSVNDLTAKIGRSARVSITLKNETIEPVNKTAGSSQQSKAANVNINNKSTKPINNSQQNSTDYQYGDEFIYFEELEKTSPFLHHKLVDKIKYFDPAFHSITPEGFNSRLTFLHQCTRQGGTFSASDKQGLGNSANLAFGAPPVCVLRLGDFYNTKIIIDSLNITYDDTNWDLNDEGIGVMPMYADVTITFKFLGGSDLNGPISRLQNAVSFNYYANTGVYEKRAEQVQYGDNGNINRIDKVKDVIKNE